MITIDPNNAYTEYLNLNGELVLAFEADIALTYLLAKDLLIINNYWWEKTWSERQQNLISVGVNCSDTFGYAVADAEELLYSEIEDLFQHVMKDDEWGSIVWCIKKRKQKPIEPLYDILLKSDLWKDDINNLFNTN